MVEHGCYCLNLLAVLNIQTLKRHVKGNCKKHTSSSNPTGHVAKTDTVLIPLH